MHFVLDLALRRGLLDPTRAGALQERLQAGAPLQDLLREAGLEPSQIQGLVDELQAAAQGITAPLSPAEADLQGGGFVVQGRSQAGDYGPGDRVGEFELIELLGQGGMGAVYRARELNLEREVALKLVSPAIAGDPESRQRFLREARSAAAVNHPNVITILRVVDEEVPFMVLEFLPGGDADDLRRAAGGRLSERRALEIARDCARGLCAIESRGLVHRDLKPANVFLSEDGAAKLADLGLARTQGGDDRMTQTGIVVGTPAFMSPEQADGDEVDIRSDIYSLGATLYHMLSGSRPFNEKTTRSFIMKILNNMPPPIRQVNPTVPQELSDIIERAMAKKPEDRYQHPGEMEAELTGLFQRLAAEFASRSSEGT